jgi:N-acetylglucosamine-6-sulfatase
MGRMSAVAALLAAVLLTTACAAPAARADSRPNVVLILTDDLSNDLMPYLPHVQELQKAGMSFTNYTVTDSLCCPSRASILTGRFPHNTGIFTNTGTDGGYDAFQARGEESQTFAAALQQAGYRTALMGKYLNGYEPTDAVPPGWSEWDVAGNAYAEFNYDLNENGNVVHYGSDPADYLTDVLSGKATAFLESAAAQQSPFLLEVATFAPHRPYTPAPADQDSFAGLTAPRGPAFDTLPTNPPSWLASRTPLTQRQIERVDTAFRKRAQSVQAVDRMLAAIRDTLARTGQADNTVIVFSSDNGYHLGQYRLIMGKMTAFDTDVQVPLVVAGPGIPAGTTNAAVAQNIDLAPTFDDLAGVSVPSDVDGRSLVPLLHGQQPADWPAALIEHHGPDLDPADPDQPDPNSGNPTSYEALRTAHYTYVEYADGQREYYDRATDPAQLNNAAATLPAPRLTQLHDTLAALRACRGGTGCAAAARAAP